MIRGVVAVLVVAFFGVVGTAGAQTESEWIPPLDLVARDKGEMAFDGCRPKPENIEPVMCIYGDRDSDHTVALFGDSHAMQWGPPLIRLAERRGWRLVTFLRAGCPVADVKFESNCDQWRDLAFADLADQRPGHVIVSTSIARRYTLRVRGKLLTRKASERFLAKGMTRTLRRLSGLPSLVRRGPRVKLIRDQVTAPFLPPRCLANNPENPDVCRFARERRWGPGFDIKGAKRVGLERLGQWKERIGTLPLVAIGGITPDRAPGVIAAGADSVAVITDFMTAPDPAARMAEWLVWADRWRRCCDR